MTTFASALSPRGSPARSWLRPRRGWIGLDIGTSATKVVQLERLGDTLRIAAHWLIDDYSGGLLTADGLRSAGPFPLHAQLQAVRSTFRGRNTAANLPLAMTVLRSLELPAGSDDELRNMIHDELQADDAAAGPVDYCFDYVQTQSGSSAEDNLPTFSVFAVPHDTALATANGLSRAGLDCEVLDSLPCALARATMLGSNADPQSPIAALDFGYSSAILIVARDGHLLFSRQLRGHGLLALLKPIQDGLHLTAAEATPLISQPFASLALQSPSVAALTNAATALLAEPLAQMAAEVKRTLDFLDLQFRSIFPRQLLLLGGGALLPAVPKVLAEETELGVHLWSMPRADDDAPWPEAPLFGVAAALSALAWRAR